MERISSLPSLQVAPEPVASSSAATEDTTARGGVEAAIQPEGRGSKTDLKEIFPYQGPIRTNPESRKNPQSPAFSREGSGLPKIDEEITSHPLKEAHSHPLKDIPAEPLDSGRGHAAAVFALSPQAINTIETALGENGHMQVSEMSPIENRAFEKIIGEFSRRYEDVNRADFYDLNHEVNEIMADFFEQEGEDLSDEQALNINSNVFQHLYNEHMQR